MTSSTFIHNVCNHPLLSDDDMRALINDVRAGATARRMLVLGTLSAPASFAAMSAQDAVHAFMAAIGATDAMIATGRPWTQREIARVAGERLATADERPIQDAVRVAMPGPFDAKQNYRMTTDAAHDLIVRVVTHTRPLPDTGIAALIRIARSGLAATERIVRCNGRLAVRLAKRRARTGMTLEDRIMAAQIGMTKAVARFDPALGYTFSTYATMWVHEEISRTCMTERHVIRIPDRHEALLTRLRKLFSVGTSASTDSVEGIAEQLNADASVISDLLPYTKLVKSIDFTSRGSSSSKRSLVSAKSGTETSDEVLARCYGVTSPMVSPEHATHLSERHRLAHALLAELDKPADRDLLCRLYGLHGKDEELQVDIAQSCGITRKAIQQRKNVLLKRLRTRASELGLDAAA